MAEFIDIPISEREEDLQNRLPRNIPPIPLRIPNPPLPGLPAGQNVLTKIELEIQCRQYLIRIGVIIFLLLITITFGLFIQAAIAECDYQGICPLPFRCSTREIDCYLCTTNCTFGTETISYHRKEPELKTMIWSMSVLYFALAILSILAYFELPKLVHQ